MATDMLSQDDVELFELEILHMIDLGRVWHSGGIHFYGHEAGGNYDGSYCNDQLNGLIHNDEFVDLDDNGTPFLTDEGRAYMNHMSATGAEPVPTYSDPELWTSRIGVDPMLTVELVFAREVDTLRELLAQKAALYRAFSDDSDLVKTLIEAKEIIKGRAKYWEGDDDDHPEFILPTVCPHPLMDCWGYCECCRSDLTCRD